MEVLGAARGHVRGAEERVLPVSVVVEGLVLGSGCVVSASRAGVIAAALGVAVAVAVRVAGRAVVSVETGSFDGVPGAEEPVEAGTDRTAGRHGRV